MNGEIFSISWYGRRFRLSSNMLCWGLFQVNDPRYPYESYKDRQAAEQHFKTVNPSVIADIFENLLTTYQSESLAQYYEETRVMAQYSFATESILSKSPSENRGEYINAIYELQRSFEDALLVVFLSADPLKGESAEFYAYRPTLAEPNSALFKSSNGFYHAIFDRELVLKMVLKQPMVEEVYPKRYVAFANSEIVERLVRKPVTYD